MNSASGKKKQLKKKPHMESKTSNDDLDTYICDDINGTFTACGGEFTFWKLKKFWYFTDNHFTVIIAIYPKCYDIKRNVRIVYFYFNLELCFKLRLFSRDVCWF